MTVKELRYLVDNLDEYIHVPGGIERLKKTVLHLAVSGQLVPQDPSEGTGEELYRQIQVEKTKLIAAGKLKKPASRTGGQKPLPAITEAEIPFAIPKTWKWVRLQEVVTLITDGTHHTPQYRSTGVPFLSIKDISAGSLDFTKCKYISKIEHDEINRRCNPEFGDILFCRIGTLGRPVVVNVDQSFSIFVSLGLIKFDQKKLLSQYLKLFLEAPQTYRQYSKIMAGGSHTNKLNLEAMKSLVVVLPPTYEQVRIVKKVDTIFALIDELAEKYRAEQAERARLVASSLAQLARGNGDLALTHLSEIIRTKADAAQLRKTILHLGVSGQLTTQDPAEGTGEELFQQIQAEKAKLIAAGKLKRQKPLPAITEPETPFAVPKTWKWARLGDVSQVIGGGTPSSSNEAYYTEDHDDGIAWLTPADLRGYHKVYISHGKRSITKEGLQKSSAQIMPKGTVLFSSRAPIGHIAIAANELATNQGFKSMVPHTNLSAEYLYRWLQFYAPVIDSNASGTTFREVSGAIVARQPIPLPPLAEQVRIVQKTTQLLDLIANLEPHLEK